MSCSKGAGRKQQNDEILQRYDLAVTGQWLEGASPQFKLATAQRLAADSERRQASIQAIMRSPSKPSVDEQLRRQLHPKVAVGVKVPPMALVNANDDAVQPGRGENLVATDFEERLRRGDFVTMKKLKTKVHAVRAVIRMNTMTGLGGLSRRRDCHLHPLSIHIETPAKGKRGCSRMTVSPTDRRAGRASGRGRSTSSWRRGDSWGVGVPTMRVEGTAAGRSGGCRSGVAAGSAH